MITQTYRPQKFSDVAGQELNKRILKAIVKRPQDSPRSILMAGEYGTGKTTCARIFARALNCENPHDGEPCGKCNSCKEDIGYSSYYAEYDAAVIGNVEKIIVTGKQIGRAHV